jgi:hypothetical protein
MCVFWEQQRERDGSYTCWVCLSRQTGVCYVIHFSYVVHSCMSASDFVPHQKAGAALSPSAFTVCSCRKNFIVLYLTLSCISTILLVGMSHLWLKCECSARCLPTLLAELGCDQLGAFFGLHGVAPSQQLHPLHTSQHSRRHHVWMPLQQNMILWSCVVLLARLVTCRGSVNNLVEWYAV